MRGSNETWKRNLRVRVNILASDWLTGKRHSARIYSGRSSRLKV